MEKESAPYPILGILFIPVYIALYGVITNFNYLDLIYLLLVAIIFGKYFIKTRKSR